VADKTEGRGRGRYTAKGVQADQEARLTALEDIVFDNIENGNLSEPEAPVEETPSEAPTEA
jgi:hypothetical protein